jgi:UDP-2,4-diacetamido-2,4,6-trideoxy-beta-L-altropyranose hydrolase
VVWGDHVNWFARKLESSETAILIGMMGDERAGVIRFDRRGECADVSINIAPHFRGRGIGKALLSKGCGMIEQNGFACRLEAAVKPDNVGSQRIFEAAGFVAVDRDQSMLYYRRGR